MDGFEKRLENLRESKNLNKKEISKKLGYSDNVYGSYERGERRPSFEALIKLANIFDVSVDYLLSGTLPKSAKDKDKFETKIMDILEKYDIDDFSFLDIENWKKLSKTDIEEINRHFEWIVERTKTTDS